MGVRNTRRFSTISIARRRLHKDQFPGRSAVRSNVQVVLGRRERAWRQVVISLIKARGMGFDSRKRSCLWELFVSFCRFWGVVTAIGKSRFLYHRHGLLTPERLSSS